MAYILTAQLYDEDEVAAPGAFDRYRAYLASVHNQLPLDVLRLATSDWYFDPGDHRCPHDAWLERVVVSELGSGARGEVRTVEIAIRLLGAYHDGHIELRYPGVVRYRIELAPGQAAAGCGHRDWRHDEFRIGAAGGVIHEIEWWGREAAGTWLIEAANVEYRWCPLAGEKSPVSEPGA